MSRGRPRRERSSARRPRAARRRPSSLWGRVLAATLLIIVLVCGALLGWSFVGGAVAGEVGSIHEVEVPQGSKGDVIDFLASRGLIESPTIAKVYVTLLTPGSDFVPRLHLIEAGASARALVRRLSESPSRQRVKVTIVEGWDHRKIAARLREKGICAASSFEASVFDRRLLDELSVSADSAEGLLFPATYQFPADSRPDEVVRRLVHEARKRLAKLKTAEPPHPDLAELRFGDWEIVTLASIVERETAVAEETPRVARVFLNRLLAPEGETNGRLQSDPTAAYGCILDPIPSCDPKGKVTPAMLADPANRYNTYRHAGLPPGPISNPGERALRAVLAPASGNDLYFVADGKGGHTFSESYAQHLEAVRHLKRTLPE